MTDYTIENIKQDVRKAIDQNMISAQLITTGDRNTLALNDIIESKITDAARIVELDAPIELLDGGININETPANISITWLSQAGYGPGSIELPENFLRLVVFKMSDWARPVYNAIMAADPRYAMQHSRFGGVRGNPQNPVVAIVSGASKASGKSALKLEFYSSAADSNAQVELAAYVPKPKIVNSKISLCESLYEAIVYKAGALTAQAIQRAELAATLEAACKELMMI